MTTCCRLAAALSLLALAGGGLSCSGVESAGPVEPVVKWVPAGQPLPVAAPGEKTFGEKTARAPELACPALPVPDNRDIVAAIEKVAEACRAPAETLPMAPEQPGHEAAPAAWPPAGPQVVDALAASLAGMGRSSLGFRVNDLVIGRIMDNGTNEQKGELDAARAYLKFLAGQSAPKNAGPVSAARAAILEGGLEKWWFPSGEKTLNQGIAALQDTSAAMKTGAVKMPGSPRDLQDLLLVTSSLLGAESARLSQKDVAETDEAFFHALGVARVAAATLTAAVASYAPALGNQGAGADLKQARQALETAAAMDPLIVLAGPPGSLRANHLLLLAYHLDRAGAALSSAAARLD